MSTFFDTCKRNFKDVPVVDDKVSTTEFLEASESVVQLFDVLGSTAFVPVQRDMTGNIKKIRDAQLAHPATSGTLQEIADSDPTAAEGLLWLNRGLEFTSLALRKNVDSNEELTASFTSSYNDSLKKHHNMIVRGIFSVAMKACPYRADFYKKLGDDQAAVETKMKEWLAALEKIVGILNVYLAAKKI
ncbi:glycolipid transfer protein domain-containing protein [Tricharina praecox]|uniref:glycolipid transfer protein domain-containing protein n=1 Tax=Tricharina praecox TaxID=43433 RepID=UPI00221EC763|nr:glycolipid transfer protein domain-containing protein [Tricharina praecox]KAI5850648.1 glycolipid transfer protein domain-containing protein [Tricharina praecox]